tara:strand:+ start:6950 stop:7204 length:255 start_codon:yes stop_codon:yes gene_type:complete
MKTKHNNTTETEWSRKAEEIWLKQSDVYNDRGDQDPGDRWFWWASAQLSRLYRSMDWIESRPVVCGLIAAAIGLTGGLIVGANI